MTAKHAKKGRITLTIMKFKIVCDFNVMEPCHVL